MSFLSSIVLLIKNVSYFLDKMILGPVHTMSHRWAEPIPLSVFTVKFIYGTVYETKNFNWLES